MLFNRLHFEGYVTVHSAELALVMGTAPGYLQKRKCLPIGIAVYCSCKVHIYPSFFGDLLTTVL